MIRHLTLVLITAAALAAVPRVVLSQVTIDDVDQVILDVDVPEEIQVGVTEANCTNSDPTIFDSGCVVDGQRLDITRAFRVQAANKIFAGPTVAPDAVPTFRDVVSADFPANIVTFEKFQQIATDRLLGRDTANTGDVEALTVGGGLEFTGSGGIQRSALSGDVAASAGSGTTAISSTYLNGLSAKSSVVAGDKFAIADSAAGGASKNVLASVFLPMQLCRVTLPTVTEVVAGVLGPSNSNETADLLGGSCSIPAATLTATAGRIHVMMSFSFLGNNGSSDGFNPRIKLGGTTLWSDSSGTFTANAAAHQSTMDFWIVNTATNTQRGYGRIMVGAPEAATIGLGDFTATNTRSAEIAFAGSKDTSGALTLALTMQLNVSAANTSMTIHYILVEVWP